RRRASVAVASAPPSLGQARRLRARTFFARESPRAPTLELRAVQRWTARLCRTGIRADGGDSVPCHLGAARSATACTRGRCRAGMPVNPAPRGWPPDADRASQLVCFLYLVR